MSQPDHPHGTNWRQWLGHLSGTPAHGLELGSFRGESAEWMCRNIFSHPDAVYTCVDTFKGSAEHALGNIDVSRLEEECRRRLGPYPQARIIKGLTRDVLRTLLPGFDFVYIDAAHDAVNVLRDSVLAWDLLKVGGTAVWDDLTWAVLPDPLDCPAIAIDAFMACYARQVEIIGKGSQVAARKVA